MKSKKSEKRLSRGQLADEILGMMDCVARQQSHMHYSIFEATDPNVNQVAVLVVTKECWDTVKDVFKDTATNGEVGQCSISSGAK